MRTALLIAVAVSMSPLRGIAQAPGINVSEAELRLGMSRAELVSELQKHSLYLSKGNSILNESEADSTMNPDSLEVFAIVKFSRDRLAYIEKFWRPSHAPDTDTMVADALYGAAGSVSSGESRTCALRTFTASEPSEEDKGTSIECKLPNARRSVAVFIKTFRFDKEVSVVQINEILEAP